MMGFASIAGGSASATSGMTEHLVNQTMTPEMVGVAAYYGRGGPEDGLAVVRPDTDPAVLRALGIDQTKPLDADQISALLAGRMASGELVNGKHYFGERDPWTNPKTGEERISQAIGAYDFCPTPHKSVSVAFALAGPVEQAMILNAHREAARETVSDLVKEVGQIRLGDGGKDGRVEGKTTWLEFTHVTARRTLSADGTSSPGKPNLHTHHLVPNCVIGPDGKIGSLDTMAIRGLLFQSGQEYQSKVGRKLRDAGFEVVMEERTGAARMTVVPEAVNVAMSDRTNRGEEKARQWTEAGGEVWEDLTKDQRTARMKAATQDRNDNLETVGGRTKGIKDDLADVEHWRAESKGLGWEPATMMRIGPPEPELNVEQKHRMAYETALPWLAEQLEHRSVLTSFDLNVAALRGMTAAGLDGRTDLAEVVDIMRTEGVRQNGQLVGLVEGQEPGKRHVSITTTMHRDDEAEFINLAQTAGADKSQAIPHEAMQRHIEASGLDFSDTHGQAQKAAIEYASEAKLAVIVAASGAGKTTAIKPLRAAWEASGRVVWGTSLASRQSDDLADAGIHPNQTRAFIPFMQALQTGAIKLSSQSVLVVDELGTLGARQALELLRHQRKMGFTVVALGDPAQCNSIMAGPTIKLLKQAIPEAIPEIITTRRQHGREAEVSSALRAGDAAKALAMKREDGRAEMVQGGRAGVIARTAALYVERLQTTGEAPGINAPTNQDAHEISAAVRLERRAMGLVSKDLMTVKATDGKGRDYDLKLAKGDRVRLFASTGASFPNGRGGVIGRNGSVLEVLDANGQGLSVRNLKTNQEGVIDWHKLNHGNRTMLAYGDCLTIVSSQGSSKGEQLTSFPEGVGKVSGNDTYSALTRHMTRSHLITSEMAERMSVKKSRPLNDTREITDAAKWANVAKTLADFKQKDSATDMLSRVSDVRVGSVKDFQQTLLPAEPAHRAGKQRSLAPEVVARRQTLNISELVQTAKEFGHTIGKRVEDLVHTIQQRINVRRDAIRHTQETTRHAQEQQRPPTRGLGISR